MGLDMDSRAKMPREPRKPCWSSSPSIWGCVGPNYDTPNLTGGTFMKTRTIIAWLVVVAGAVAADSANRIPQQDAKAYAKLCVERAAAIVTDAQISMDVDVDK